MNIIIVNMSYFKNILLFECQPPPLEQFLYPPLLRSDSNLEDAYLRCSLQRSCLKLTSSNINQKT